MTTPMTSDQRHVLLNYVYDTDHLVWLYRAAIDQTPSAHLTSEHMCLVDFASRAAALARSLLDEDNRRRESSAGFKPSATALRERLRSTLAARRHALQQHAAPAAPEQSPEQPRDDTASRPAHPSLDPEWRDAEPDFDGEHDHPPMDEERSPARRRTSLR